MQTKESTIFQLQLDSNSISELLGVLPFEILMILRDVYPEGKIFKELKKSIEERLQDWLNKKNKSNSLTDQAIYYQLRKLKDLGFIEASSEKELDTKDRLVTSQKYRLTSLKYVINFSDHYLKIKDDTSLQPIPEAFKTDFLQTFSSFGKFNGLIVIGTGSSDVPFIGPLSYLLGKYFDMTNLSFVVYDGTILDDSDDKKIKEMLSKNLILLGGPNVNRVFHSTIPSQTAVHKSLNEVLPVKFVQAPDSGIIIQESATIILSKNQKIGVIQRIDNPWNPNNKIFAIGGPKRIGTEAAVLAFTKYFETVTKTLMIRDYCLIEALVDSKDRLVETKVIQ